MLSEGLRSVVDSLSKNVLPVDARARELAALGESELRDRLPELERLPFVEQVRLKRLIAEYRKEQFGGCSLPSADTWGQPAGVVAPT